MDFGKKYAWLQMVMWLGIDQWSWTMNIWHIINKYMYLYNFSAIVGSICGEPTVTNWTICLADF